MIPELPHAPPRGDDALAIVSGTPPAASMRFSFPSAKKPIDLPSGDQNGKTAFSVPRNGSAAGESSRRIHSTGGPSAGFARKTMFWPSGDKTAAADSKSNVA